MVADPFTPNPEVLAWARSRIGLTPEAASKALGIDQDALANFEQGKAAPGVTLLRRMAQVYHVQLLALLMPAIPQYEPALPTDFRTVGGEAPRLSPESLGSIFDAIGRQSAILDLLEESPDLITKAELPLASEGDDPISLGEAERARLAITVNEQLRWPGAEEAFNFWRTRVEEEGVYVFMAKLPREDCRGFSFGAESLAPVIVINDNEVTQAQIFTLFHELAHVMRRDAALCLEKERTDRGEVEQFCNRFAAALLMPPDAIARACVRESVNPERDGWDLEAVGSVARRLKVSRPALILRLRDLGHDVQGLYEAVAQEWEDSSWRVRDEGRGGPVPYHYRLTKSLGAGFVNVVLSAYQRGRITVSEACETLGSRRTHFDSLAHYADQRLQRYGRRT